MQGFCKASCKAPYQVINGDTGASAPIRCKAHLHSHFLCHPFWIARHSLVPRAPELTSPRQHAANNPGGNLPSPAT